MYASGDPVRRVLASQDVVLAHHVSSRVLVLEIGQYVLMICILCCAGVSNSSPIAKPNPESSNHELTQRFPHLGEDAISWPPIRLL